MKTLIYSRPALCLAAVTMLTVAGCGTALPLEEAKNADLRPIADADIVLNGSEALGDPSIPIAPGSGVVAAGTGLVEQPGTIELNVPGAVAQALLYWYGEGRIAGDDTVDVDFNGGGVQAVTGDLIGGPTFFFWVQENVYGSTYRADVTGMIQSGDNTLIVSGAAFNHPTLEPAMGAGLLVIYDDGTTTDIFLRDGQDLAFAFFAPPLDATVPQVYTFDPAGADRTASLDMFFASVCNFDDPNSPRPSIVRVSVDGGDVTDFVNVLEGGDGCSWDTLDLSVIVPVGSTQITVEAISFDDGSGDTPASFSWIASGLTLTPEVECTGKIGDLVWMDLDQDGCQDPNEPPMADVPVTLYDACDAGAMIATTATDVDGTYMFEDLCAGEYLVVFDAPAGYEETIPNAACGGNDEDDSDCVNGMICVTLPTDDTIDLTNDCGLAEIPQQGQGCTPGYWKQPHHFGNWTAPYMTDMQFSDVFEDALPGMTLVEVLAQGGGGLKALGRHTVAALLNAASNEVNYGMSPQEVIDAFNDAHPGTKHEYNQLKDYFEDLNEQGCPLGRAPAPIPTP